MNDFYKFVRMCRHMIVVGSKVYCSNVTSVRKKLRGVLLDDCHADCQRCKSWIRRHGGETKS